MTAPRPILIVVDDFLTRVRIQEVARLLHVAATAVGPLDARANAKASAARAVILDLNLASASSVQVIEDLRADQELRDLPIVGFYAHVDRHVADAASKAGASTVLPRSRFHARLVEILQDLSSGP